MAVTKLKAAKPIKLYPHAVLEAKMEAWGKRAASAQAEGHKVACSVLLHFGTHKDVRIIQRFVMLVPEMVRTNGLKAWFEAHAAVKFIVDESSADAVERVLFVKDKFGVGKEAVKLGEGMAKPFWKFKALEGAPYKPIDEAEWVSGAIQRLRRDTAKTGADHSQLLRALEHYHDAPANLPVIPADDPLMITPINPAEIVSVEGVPVNDPVV